MKALPVPPATAAALRVCVDAATVWSSPGAPRPVDAAAVAAEPDLAAWTRAMDREVRLGLHGRCETQLLRGEPVELIEDGAGGWVRVAAPWQPTAKDVRGYPGWVRRAHLEATQAGGDGGAQLASPPVAAHPIAVAAGARRFLGVRYLWGGLTSHGLDCSGLVHLSYRRAGIVVPRDAAAQHSAASPIRLGDERPGDLYFFGADGGQVVHVGFVTGALRMLHAPEDSELVEDAPLTGQRRAALVGAGRLQTSDAV